MNPRLSLYLDLVRFVAAMLVFLDHASRKRLGGPMLGHVEWLAEAAVLVFFVLSGYVIAFAADCKERTLGSYAVARAARIYSVVVPALLLTFLADRIGMALKPALYANWYPTEAPAWALGASFLFLNELWFQGVRMLSDGPYWSVTYEVWYYAFFACALFLRGAPRFIASAAVLLIAGPKIVVLLPVWLLGVAAYWIGKRAPVSRAVGIGLLLASTLGLLAFFGFDTVKALSGPSHHALAWVFPGADMRYSKEFLSGWLLGLLVAAHFLAAEAVTRHGWRFVPAWAGGVIAAAASATFALYLFHNPLLHLYASALPLKGLWLNAAVMALTLATVFLLAPLTEGKKHVVKRWILAACGRRAPAAA